MKGLHLFGWNDLWKEKAANDYGWEAARVTAQYKGSYKIVTGAGSCLAEVSGNFRHTHQALEMYPAVGDFVLISWHDSGQRAVIHRVLPRKSSFVRTAVGVKEQPQVVAVNIDFVLICMALNQNYNLNRLERYLSIAWDSGAVPIVVLTKADLCTDLPKLENEVFQIAALTDVLTVSMWDTDLQEKLMQYIQAGVTAALIGSSGVGKSTLLNRLLGEDILPTSEIGKAEKGRHTTTGREMFLLPNGGMVIDTPGMREIGAEHADLFQAFHDIEVLAVQCRFKNCTHQHEPGCAVRKAIEAGDLDRRRLTNYEKIRREAKYDRFSSKQIEADKMERMFKDFGGVKNAKKIIKAKNKRRN